MTSTPEIQMRIISNRIFVVGDHLLLLHWVFWLMLHAWVDNKGVYYSKCFSIFTLPWDYVHVTVGDFSICLPMLKTLVSRHRRTYHCSVGQMLWPGYFLAVAPYSDTRISPNSHDCLSILDRKSPPD